MIRFLAILLVLCFALPLSGVEKPVVLWSSNPVEPGETVMLYGGNWNASARIRLLDVPSQPIVEPTVATDTNITFVYPESHPNRTLRGVVQCDGLESAPFTINAPNVWWIQGDWGKDATPGGWVRLFGTTIAPDPKTVVLELRRKGETAKIGPLKTDLADRWSIRGAVPEIVPAGEYEILLDGNPLADTIRIERHVDVWKTTVYNVVDFGAIPNDGLDDTPAVQSALEQLSANGGGILHFPRGRFQISGELNLPPKTLLRGESRELSQLYWVDTYTPPDALIRGTHSFGIEDITIFSGNHRDGIVSNTLEDEENGRITIRRVRVRLIFTQYLYMTPDEMSRRAIPLHHKRLLRLGGEFIRVNDCDLHAAGGGVYEIAGNWVDVSNNRLSKGEIQGWNGFGGSRMIFENNHLAGPMCTSYYNRREGSRNIYWGYNVHDQTYDGNNRETITADLRDQTYIDTAESWEETGIVLKNPKWTARKNRPDWIGGCVQLMDGKGAGQFRTITKISTNRIEIDRPWDIKPDKETLLLIAGFRYRFLYIGNKVSDSSIGMQFYGSMIEPIVAESTFERTGGAHGFGMAYEPNWFFQYLDNTILEGNGQRGPYNDVPPKDAHLGFCDMGVPGARKYSQSRACVMRRNLLLGNARLASRGLTDSVLVERNIIENADVGLDLPAPGRNLQARNNRFKNVVEPYRLGSDEVHLDPAERLAGNLEGASTLLTGRKSPIPTDWTEIEAALNTLENDSRLTGESRKRQVEKLLLWAVRSLSKSLDDKPIDPRLAEILFGGRVTTPNWRPVTELLQRGNAGEANLLLRIPDHAMLPMKVHVAIDPTRAEKFADGWNFSDAKIDFQPGRFGDTNFSITKPQGAVELVSFPIVVELVGDGWSLKMKDQLADPHAVFTIKQQLVAGPIENTGLKTEDSLITLPKFKAEPGKKYRSVRGEQDWKPAPLKQGGVDLRELLACEKGNQIAYCISALKATRPMSVRVAFSPGLLLYVNGVPAGTTLQRGQWACVRLKEGINPFVLVAIDNPQKNPTWRITPPRITQIEPLYPGELKELSVNELLQVEKDFLCP